ncbi:hypothetical protein ACE3MQ_25060 [Paenibacillus lentus]|uniref:hypothetical protein n=1 Tax=Paenibacillus lentus TaxID=1338368 RepID=UPI003659AC5D
MTKQGRDWQKDMEIIQGYKSSEDYNPKYEKTLLGTPVVDVLEYYINQAMGLSLRVEEYIYKSVAEKERADKAESQIESIKNQWEALTSLYPEKETKTFTFDAIIHVYDGIRTTVQKPRLKVEAESEKDAEKKLSRRIQDNYKISSHLSISSLQLELVEEGEAK